MNAYKTTPLLALTTLEKIAEEIPSGVSAEIVGETVTMLGPNPYEITENLQRSSAEAIKNSLRWFWKEYEIEKKLEIVKNGKIGEENGLGISKLFQDALNATQARGLKLEKAALLENIKKNEQQNQELENLLRSKANLIKKQMNSIETCDFIL